MPHNTCHSSKHIFKRKLWNLILWSGFVAGLSEIIWVTLYCLVTNADGMDIPHHITDGLFPSLPYSNYSLILAILIHFTLSFLTSIGFVRTIWLPFTRHYHLSLTLVFGGLVGVILWMVNFWIILPLINKSFIQSLSYGITFISELAFGVILACSVCIIHRINTQGNPLKRIILNQSILTLWLKPKLSIAPFSSENTYDDLNRATQGC